MADCTYNGAAYSEGSLICVNGKELSCYAGVWAETGRACTSIDPSSASVRATQLQISRSAAGPTAPFPPYEYGINVGGTIDQRFPHVYTMPLPAKIQRIVGKRMEGFSGLCIFSGEGTTVLVVEVYPNGVIGAQYQGAAICTVIY